MNFSRTRFGAVALIAVMGLTAACGTKGEDSTEGSSQGGSNATATKEVAALTSGKLDFPMPEEKVDPGSHNVAIIAGGLASSGPATLVKNAQDAMRKAGWKVGEPGDGKFSPSTQSSLIEKAVLDGADGLILVLIDPASVAAAIKSAQAANIPIVCALCAPNLPEGIVNVSYDPVASGNAQAAYATSVAGPKDTIVVYQNNEFAYNEIQAKAAASHAKKLCPGCKIETPSLLLAESNTPNAPVFTQLLNDYPQGKLTSVVMPFDTPAGVLANAASQMARTDLHIIGVGGLAPFIDMVGTGKPSVATADVLYATPFYGWASVDQMARRFAGKEAWNSSNLPVAIVDKDTYGDYEKGNVFAAPTTDFKAEFAGLWGK